MKKVDLGVLQALQHYILYGMHPGSLGHALLLGDRDLAIQKSHVFLKREPEIIDNMLAIVSTFPQVCHGDLDTIRNWTAHFGLYGAPNKIRTIARLEWDESILGKWKPVIQLPS